MINLKKLLNENVLGDLPSSKLMKMKWNPVTDKKSEVKEERLTEASLKSNIMQKWNTTSVIQQDLMGFISHAMDAGGEDLVNDIYMALKNSTEYARRVIRKG